MKVHILSAFLFLPLVVTAAEAKPLTDRERFCGELLLNVFEVTPLGFSGTVHSIPMGLPTKIVLEKTDEVIRFANDQFKRRGWDDSFLAERISIAREFAKRSEYVYTTLPSGAAIDSPSVITGSIGVTVAQYDGKYASELLPMEKSHGWKLDRPRDGAGKGLIIEGRTYAKLKAVDGSEAFSPYSPLWAGMNRIIRRELKSFPELADKEIIFTYGDTLSDRLYLPMGFRIDTRYAPVIHDGVEWHVLVTTPNNFLKNFMSDSKARFLTHGDGAGVTIKPTPELALRVEDNVVVHGGKPVSAILNEDQEIYVGISGAKGAKIQFFNSGKLAFIEKLAGPSLLGDIKIDPERGIRFDEAGRMEFQLSEDAHLGSDKIFVPVGATVLLSENLDLLEASRLGADVRVPNTPWTAKRGGVFQLPYQRGTGVPSRLVFYSAKTIEVIPGRIGAEGSRISIAYAPDGVIRFYCIEKTAQDLVVRGIHIPRGSQIVFDPNGEIFSARAAGGSFLVR